MKRISWIKKISNERVLEMVEMQRCLIPAIRQRQLSFVGHIVRKAGIEKLVMEGKIEGRKQRGRPRLAFLEGLAVEAGCGTVELLRQVGDRTGCRKMITNVRP